MNSIFKSLVWIVVGAGTLIFGLRFQMDKKIQELETEQGVLTARASELVRDTSLARAKLEQARIDSTAGADFEAKYTASVANIAVEQKKIEEISGKWPAVEADRAAAVKAVREKESVRAPYSLTLTDGTKLDNFVVRSVPEENLVSVEHSSGLVKITADKLPEELKKRLGLGWKPVPPPIISIDKDGNTVIKQAVTSATEKAAADEAIKGLGLAKIDTSTMAGVTNALALVESQLVKAQAAFEAEKANIRKLEMFKPNTVASGSNKTYGLLKKEGSIRLANHAGRVKALRGEKANLQHKLKSF